MLRFAARGGIVGKVNVRAMWVSSRGARLLFQVARATVQVGNAF
jgi:hypothetical protein